MGRAFISGPGESFIQGMVQLLNIIHTHDALTGLFTASYAVRLSPRGASRSAATRQPQRLRSRAGLQSLDIRLPTDVRSRSTVKDLPPLAPLDGGPTQALAA